MKCPCGENVSFSRRKTLKQVLELNAALTRAAEHEDFAHSLRTISCGIFAGYPGFESTFNESAVTARCR
jgi:hypothetical protein